MLYIWINISRNIS
ncbi:hypothetical protein VTL71DRAFT_10206 [Oculimacula yallundae]|uniref:Uncharacterized protein n=1 Tax=Oculimacula yallundae TaxID=86028 RepID=A0ABR4BPI5_9HELO